MSDSNSGPLRIDTAFLHNTEYGVKPETVQKTQEEVDKAIVRVEERVTANEYGFLSILQHSFADKMISQTQAVFDSLSWCKAMIVVGIGGSDLGARAIQQGLQVDAPPMEVIFHGDSTDPEQIRQLELRIQKGTIALQTTVFVIISKSGETVETISQYLYWKERLSSQQLPLGKHFIFITDAKKGILQAESKVFDVQTLAIPDEVGGRFSVLTPVGLLPALAMGVNISDLVNGALEFIQSKENRSSIYEYVSAQYRLFLQGLPVVVLMPYSVRLEEFARWFRQLWAESLGKDGTGILPIQARGPADQHSQVQFYAQGSPLMSLLFIALEKPVQNYTLPATDIPSLMYLSGHTFQEINLAEQKATAQALYEAGRPSATITLEKLDASSLGSLFIFFELGVVFAAEVLQVNAFDQPGVEQGKQIMYRLLGKSV
jgi:glucose-6-phosphate isomerase